MRSPRQLSILALFGAASAAPRAEVSRPVHALAKRNVCDGVDATPVLYTEYHADSCPPIHTMNDDGSCSGQDPDLNDCVTFCQVRTTFTYGQEIPVANSYCHGPLTCTITDTTTVTVTKSLNVNIGWDKYFKGGITGGFTYADATAHARSYSVKLDQGQCGYFTVVPVWKETCGSITEGHYGAWPVAWCEATTTSPNVCANEQRLNSDGTVDSETIFVRTDCSTRQPTQDNQDPIWQRPGVPLDRSSYDTLSATWATVGEASQGIPPPPSYATGTCAFHLREEWLVDPVRTDGEAHITMKLYDNAQNEIGHLDQTVIGNGQAIDMTSALPYTVHVVPGDTGEDWEYWNYYDFQFSYADQSWPMSQSDGTSRCNVGGRDLDLGSDWMTQDMDCFFPC